MDTGSSGFWTYGPNATINDGSDHLFTKGPCNYPVKNFYNWPASESHTKPVYVPDGLAYVYSGNAKIESGYYTINDTFSFPNTKWPALKNNHVALINSTLVRQLDGTPGHCVIGEKGFDHSILGLSPYVNGGVTPSFRQDLLDQGQIQSSTLSMWFDAPPADVKGDFQGTALFGAVPPASKYSGQLVSVKPLPPSGTYVGYYVGTPKVSIAPLHKPSAGQVIKTFDATVKQCLLDSGTGTDNLPIDQASLLAVSGLIKYVVGSQEFVAYNGSCNTIPTTATLNYTFAGLNGKSVIVAVPIRNYARGELDDIVGASTKVCGLSMTLDNTGGCTLGAPFFTAAFLAFNDEKNQIAIAQGGVSSGASNGQAGLGAITVVKKGQGLPGL